MTRIAFIGLGMMGRPMADRLIAAGFDVRVSDVNPALAAEFGSNWAESPQLAAQGAEIVMTMLPTGRVVREVLLGDGGVAASLKPGAIVIDTSSSEAGGTVDLGGELAANGVTLIDAPVSGGVPLAREGKLTLMIGGADDALFAKVQPVLAAVGAKLVRVGPLGSGHAAKAINMAVAGAVLAATCEGLLLGEKFGITPEVLLDVINSSTGGSTVSQTVVKNHIVPKTFAQGFSLALMTKDIRIANALREDIGLTLPLLTETAARWGAALESLPVGSDFSAYFQYAEAEMGA